MDLQIADQAHKAHTEIVEMRKSIERSFLYLAKNLYEVHKNKWFKVLGYETFSAYCATPEVDLQRSRAYDFIAIYEKFIQKLQVPEERLERIGTSKLSRIATRATEDNAEQLLGMAEGNSYADLMKNIRDIEPTDCPHVWKEHTVWKCEKCNQTTKERPN